MKPQSYAYYLLTYDYLAGHEAPVDQQAFKKRWPRGLRLTPQGWIELAQACPFLLGWLYSLDKDERLRVNLTNAEGGSATILRGVNLSGAIMHGVYLTHSDLRSVRMNEATGANAVLFGAQMSYAHIISAHFPHGDFSLAWFINADLTYSFFKESSFVDAYMPHALAGRAVFAGANMQRAQMTSMLAEGADFSGANLEGAHLDCAEFAGANFAGANLKGASLKDTDFSNANFSGADLTGAFVHNTNFYNVRYDKRTVGLASDLVSLKRKRE